MYSTSSTSRDQDCIVSAMTNQGLPRSAMLWPYKSASRKDRLQRGVLELWSYLRRELDQHQARLPRMDTWRIRETLPACCAVLTSCSRMNRMNWAIRALPTRSSCGRTRAPRAECPSLRSTTPSEPVRKTPSMLAILLTSSTMRSCQRLLNCCYVAARTALASLSCAFQPRPHRSWR